jgi:outer membrane protein
MQWVWTLALIAANGGSSEVFEALQPTQGGLTAALVIEKALATAPSVMKAEAQVEARDADSDVAFLAFAPRLEGIASYTRISDGFAPGLEPLVRNDFYLLRGIVSVPVSDYFLTAIYEYQGAFIAEDAARHQAHAVRETTALRAVQSYLDAVRARAAALVAQSSVDVLTAQYEDLRRMADAGLRTEGDVLQVKAQLATTRVSLEQAKGLVRVTREALRRAIHEEDPVLEHGEVLFGEHPESAIDEKDALQLALAERYEVRALQKVIEGREKQASYAFGRVFPQLFFGFQAEYSKPNQRFFREEPEFDASWLLTVGLGWSPNDAIRAWSETNKADQEVEAAKADLAELTDAIAVEVTGAVSTYRASRESIAAASEAVDAAQGTFTDRQNLVNAGGGTTRELLLSEQDLRRAQLQLINAHLDLRLAQARLDRALGRLVTPPVEE